MRGGLIKILWRAGLERPEQRRAEVYVLTGQVLCVFLVGICIAPHPGFVLASHEGGVSDYGAHVKTVVPYTLAFGLLSLCTWRAAIIYKAAEPKETGLWWILVVYGLLISLMLVSSYVYTLYAGLRDVHVVIGTALAAFEVGASWWLFFWGEELGEIWGLSRSTVGRGTIGTTSFDWGGTSFICGRGTHEYRLCWFAH
jgi:hypothetical protein